MGFKTHLALFLYCVFYMYLQRTIKKTVEINGIGLHTGQPTRLKFRPAPENTGIYFVRTDLESNPAISARAEYVKATQMATTLGGPEFKVHTIEHCMSSLGALRIDNLFIELDGPEIPIGYRSADIFFQALLNAGIDEQNLPRHDIYVNQKINYGNEEKQA